MKKLSIDYDDIGFLLILIGGLFVILGAVLGGCAPAPSPVPQPTAEQKAVAAKTLFAKQLADCVNDAGNASDYKIEMCICATAHRWGKDAGDCQ